MEEVLDAELPQRIHRNPKVLKHYPDWPRHVNIGPYYMKIVVDNFKSWKLRFAGRLVSYNSLLYDSMYYKLFEMVVELKGYYDMDSLRLPISDKNFTKLMVEDGCFILGFI